MNIRCFPQALVAILVFATLLAQPAAAQKAVISESGDKTEVAEGGASDSYTVVLDAQPPGNVTITLSFDAAQLTTDKNSLTYTTANWASPQTVTVSAVDDAVEEEPTISRNISHTASNGETARDVVVSILDNDFVKADVLIVQSGGKTEVVEAGAGDSFTLVLSKAPAENVSVNLALGVGQMTATPTNLTFTPANWANAQTVTVAAVDDASPEGLVVLPISSTVSSADPDFDGIFVQPVFVSIIDNDNENPEVGVAETGDGTQVTEGGTGDSYLVVLATQPSADVTVTVSLAAPAQLTTDRATVTFTPANWNVSQSVAVNAVNDHMDEGLHLSSITHTAVSADPNYNGIYVPEVVVTIVDNDKSAVRIVETGGNTAVTEGGPGDTYQVVLDTQPAATVAVALSVPVAQLSTDKTNLSFTVGNWSNAQTVAVAAVNDTVYTGARVALVGHAASSADPIYDGIAIAGIAVAITDNDPAILVSPQGVDLASVPLGTSSDAVFSVQNVGAGTLTGVATASAPLAVVSNAAYALLPSAVQMVTVRYTPTILGASTSVVTFSGAGGTNSRVSGNAVASSRAIGVGGSLAFGNVIVGRSASRIMTITNAGTLTLAISGITSPPGFDASWSGTLPPGRSTNVTVTFAPLSIANYGGAVIVSSDATNGVNSLPATGDGIEDAPPTVILTSPLNQAASAFPGRPLILIQGELLRRCKYLQMGCRLPALWVRHQPILGRSQQQVATC
jgi:large repetitive protein